jgi:hypothetical protein
MGRELTVDALIAELQRIKELGLGETVVMTEGCDCNGYAGSVGLTMHEGKQMVLVGRFRD